jgi:hypothetical protein
VYDPESGREFELVEGTRIQDVEIFAGYGKRIKLREETAIGLAKQHGGNPEKWQHVKGIGVVDFDGEERAAEVHWFQEESVGRVNFMLKRWRE